MDNLGRKVKGILIGSFFLLSFCVVDIAFGVNVKASGVSQDDKIISTCKNVWDNTSTKKITIKCVGDSVTDGMRLEDCHTAVLGGSTYPSALYTLLNNNGINAVVDNAGHAGEKTATIVARLGGVKLYFAEDFVFNSEGCIGPVDDKIIACFDSSLKMPINISNTSTDVNPVVIDGRQYEAKKKNVGNNDWKTFLYKKSGDDVKTIKAGTEVKLSSNNNSDVNIIFAGINDKGITIDDYVKMLKNGAAANGNRYIILGPHSKMYEKEGFVKGNTSEERRENYRKRMIAEFGDCFVDLNTDWYDRVLPIARENGYLVNYNEEQISAIQSKLAKRIIPGEFTYNNKDYDLHLNRAGYMAIAQIVYERLKLLKYI